MADTQRIGLDEVVRHFQDLEDPRSSSNRLPPLVVIALMAVVAGVGGPTAIAGGAALKEEFLRDVLDFSHGIPRTDVFRRVLMALKPGVFPACIANGLRSMRDTAAAATGHPWRRR